MPNILVMEKLYVYRFLYRFTEFVVFYIKMWVHTWTLPTYARDSRVERMILLYIFISIRLVILFRAVCNISAGEKMLCGYDYLRYSDTPCNDSTPYKDRRGDNDQVMEIDRTKLENSIQMYTGCSRTQRQAKTEW